MLKTGKIGLSSANWLDSDETIFPSRIELVTRFDDFDGIYDHAFMKIYGYKGKEMQLYISGGLSQELLETLRAAHDCHVSCALYHYNRETNSYWGTPQMVTWTPQKQGDRQSKVEFCVCKSRHTKMQDIPGIFDEEIKDTFAFDTLEEKAYQVLCAHEGEQLLLYLTGLTSAYVSILNVAARLSMPVIMKIYDRMRGDYIDLDMDR